MLLQIQLRSNVGGGGDVSEGLSKKRSTWYLLEPPWEHLWDERAAGPRNFHCILASKSVC